jgi:hypothetical protein
MHWHCCLLPREAEEGQRRNTPLAALKQRWLLCTFVRAWDWGSVAECKWNGGDHVMNTQDLPNSC